MNITKLLKGVSLFITIATLAACSSDNKEESLNGAGTEISGFLLSASTFTTSKDTTSVSPLTRGHVDDNARFIWDKGDKVSIFNYATYSISTAEAIETGHVTHFQSQMVCKAGDRIAMFYPAINGTTVKESSVFGHLDLNISEQKGMLDYLANYLLFKFGHGSVSSVTGNTARVSAVLYEQTSLCNCKFIFKQNGQTLPIREMKITGAPSKASINLVTNNSNGDLRPSHSEQTDVINVKPDSPVGLLYTALFPTNKQKETYTITVTGTDGKTYTTKRDMTLEAGKYYNFNIELETAEEPPYVECDGVKWAKSNFVVLDPCRPWCQSSYGFYKEPWSSNVTKRCVYDTFRWGVIGNDAWNSRGYYCPPSGTKEISGKMYTDPQMHCETKDFRKARYGDIVYWATCGKFRLPTAEEMTKLFTVRSWAYGMYGSNRYQNAEEVTYCGPHGRGHWGRHGGRRGGGRHGGGHWGRPGRRPGGHHEWPDCKSAYGLLFTCPENGVRTTSYDRQCPKCFSWEDIENGVFLPFAAYRTSDGCWSRDAAQCVTKYMSSTLYNSCVDAWCFGHSVNAGGYENDWKTGKRCDAHTLRTKYSPADFLPIRAVYVDK